MAKGSHFLGALVIALVSGFFLGSCGNTTNGNTDTFVAVTNIAGVPTAAIMDIPLPLSGIVAPANANNKIIVWSGNEVDHNILTATTPGEYMVTATIEKGLSASSSYTQTFSITVYDTSSSSGNNAFFLSIAVANGSSGMGSTAITTGSPNGNTAGTSVTVTATPAANHHFVKWSNNLAGMGSVSTDNPYTFDISGDTSLCAVFAPDDGVTGIFNLDGVWVVDGGGEIIASIINGNTWAFTTSYMSDNGTFTLDGNYGLIHSKNYDADIGMFVLTSPTTITAYTRYPFMDEVYYSYATKQ